MTESLADGPLSAPTLPVFDVAPPRPPPQGPPVIEVLNLHASYDGRPVLRGVTLNVYPGECLVIMGGSGCGKSTLLKHLIGSARPDEGQVKLFGRDLATLSPDEMNETRRKFGILFQSGALFNSMTVFDNIALPLREHGDADDEVIELAVKIRVNQVQLKPGDFDKMPSELSGGMKKRVGLARAIMLDPKILFYDEPSAGLDPRVSADIDELIIGLCRLGVTSVVVTHEMDSAFRIADRMVMLYNQGMDKGRVIFTGTKAEALACPDPRVRDFIRGRPSVTRGEATDADADGDDSLFGRAAFTGSIDSDPTAATG